MKFRELTRDERTVVYRAFDRWGVYEHFSGRDLIVAEGDAKMICLVSSELKPVASRLQPDYAGLAIGELKKTFVPTLPGADLFAKHSKNDRYYVVVNDTAERLVLYGRDILGESIVSASEALDENQLVVILNTLKEAIGIGRTRFAGRSLLQKGKATITTVADAGQFLRDEG